VLSVSNVNTDSFNVYVARSYVVHFIRALWKS